MSARTVADCGGKGQLSIDMELDELRKKDYHLTTLQTFKTRAFRTIGILYRLQ